MYYKHQLDYQYPEQTDQHMIEVKHLRDVILDEDYPYYQKSAWYKIKRGFLQGMLYGVIYWLLPITHGLRIEGRERLKKNKALLKGGAITVCNHVFMWDFLCIMKAVRPHLSFFPAWKTNLEGPNGPLIRLAGGIPIPAESYRAMKSFKRAMEAVLEEGKWMHFFPEGSLWFYYPDIRPLKKAVFQYAVKYNRPLIPMSISFRPRKGIQKWFGRSPLADLHIGEPLLPDQSLPYPEAVRRLHRETYYIMQEMNGVHPGDPSYHTLEEAETHYRKSM